MIHLLLTIAPLWSALSASPPASSASAPGPPSSAMHAVIAVDSLRPADEVRIAVLRRAAEIRRCYENEGLARNAALTGTLELALTILPNGVVREVSVDTSSVSAPGVAEVAACIASSARGWRFERGPYREELHVFPLRLVPEDRPGRTRQVDAAR